MMRTDAVVGTNLNRCRHHDFRIKTRLPLSTPYSSDRSPFRQRKPKKTAPRKESVSTAWRSFEKKNRPQYCETFQKTVSPVAFQRLYELFVWREETTNVLEHKYLPGTRLFFFNPFFSNFSFDQHIDCISKEAWCNFGFVFRNLNRVFLKSKLQ